MINHCKGCRYLRFNMGNLCLFRNEDKIKYCPCTDCLVKITCSGVNGGICDKRKGQIVKVEELSFSFR